MSLDKLLKEIDKKFGQGTALFLNSDEVIDIEVIPTGIQSLDTALGIGGFPRGRIIEVFGEFASGKTTLTLQVIAEAQKKGLQCAFVDLECTFNPVYAEALGVDIDKLLITQPDNAETALEIVDMMARSGDVGVIVLDSVAALSTRAEIAGEMADVTVGGVARLMGRALRKVTNPCLENSCTLFLINQLRQKIGGNPAFGIQKDTPGGMAIKYQASIRVEVVNTGKIEEGGETVGNKVKFRIKKNKLAKPHTEAETTLTYGQGFSREVDLVYLALEKEVITKKGNTYMFNEQKVAVGLAKLREAFEDETFAQMVKDKMNNE